MYHHTALRVTRESVSGFPAGTGNNWTQLWIREPNVCIFVGENDDPASTIAAADALIAALDRIRARAVAEIQAVAS
jgi:hypothetical protein